jgi:hypothetical protein
MNATGRWVGRGIKALLVVLALLGIVSLVLMALWNALVPELFHGPRIGFEQAVGLLVLSRLLFGSWRGPGGPGHWRRRRWERMTPEERERVTAWAGRCGGSGPARDTPAP